MGTVRRSNMKKGWMITLMVVAFLIGILYGASSGTPTTPEVTANSMLDEQIKHYEQVIANGEEFTSPYSEQVVNGSPKNHHPQQQPEIDDGVIEQDTSSDSLQVSGTGHNAVSRFGQEMGNFLMTLVREILRGVVRFFDQLLST